MIFSRILFLAVLMCLVGSVATAASGDQKLDLEGIEEVRGQIVTAQPPEGVVEPGGTATLQGAIRLFTTAPDSGYREFGQRLADIAREHGVEVPVAKEPQKLPEGTVGEFEDRLPLIATTYALLRESEAMSPRKVEEAEMSLALKTDLLVTITEHAPSPYLRWAGASNILSGRVLPRPGEINDHYALVDAAEAKPAVESAVKYIYDSVGGPRAEEAAVAVVKLVGMDEVSTGVAGLHMLTLSEPTADGLEDAIRLIPDPLEAIEAASTLNLQDYLRGIAENNEKWKQQARAGEEMQLLQTRQRMQAVIGEMCKALRENDRQAIRGVTTPAYSEELTVDRSLLQSVLHGVTNGEPHLLTVGVPRDGDDKRVIDIYVQIRKRDGSISQRTFDVHFSRDSSGDLLIKGVTKHGKPGV